MALGRNRMGRRGGQGQGGGPHSAGPNGVCVCPKCGHTVSHSTGTPCNKRSCPKCGARALAKKVGAITG